MKTLKELSRNPVHLLAFGFGSGLLKPAPGTWGTLAGLLLYYPLARLPAPLLAVFLVVAFVGGCGLCGRTSRDLGVHDFGGIVWDEMVAIWLLLAYYPSFTAQPGWLRALLAFLSFRLFDIWKPWPIKFFDRRLETGFGIMFDDLLAAGYAWLLLAGIQLWF